MSSITEGVRQFIKLNGSVNMYDLKLGYSKPLIIPDVLKTNTNTRDIMGNLCDIGTIVIVANGKQDVKPVLCLGFTPGGGVRYMEFDDMGNTTNNPEYYHSQKSKSFFATKIRVEK